MIKETIETIKDVTRDNMDGYVVKTTCQEISMMINNCQDCCENWGYICSEDDFSEFIGATLVDITVTDTALKTKNLEEWQDYISQLDDGGVIFINLETSKGTLQFVLYNCHNGYYGHSVEIKSNQLNIEDCL